MAIKLQFRTKITNSAALAPADSQPTTHITLQPNPENILPQDPENK